MKIGQRKKHVVIQGSFAAIFFPPVQGQKFQKTAILYIVGLVILNNVWINSNLIDIYMHL